MIIVELKPLEEIASAVKNHKNVLIAACGGCTTVYRTGGRAEAESLKSLLEAKGIRSTVTLVTRQCNKRMVASTLQPLIGNYDIVVSTACGVGPQTISDVFENIAIFPAQNTKFITNYDPTIERFSEYCSSCGECIIHFTGAVCPITRCAKSMLNGPCGGQNNGKCEVGGWKNDCAWILIYDRLKAQGKLDLFKKFRSQRDHRLSNAPRYITRERKETT
jgi:hypothetical protein